MAKAKSTGEFIAEARERAGLSQKQVGVRLGIGDKAVSAWERGTLQLPLKHLERLAEILGVQPAEILRTISPERIRTAVHRGELMPGDDLKEWILAGAALTPAERARLVRQVREKDGAGPASRTTR